MRQVFSNILLLVILLSVIILPVRGADPSWTCATDNAAFSPRAHFSMATFDNRMWIIGGIDERNTYFNDVWYSTDGIRWTAATTSAPFSPRYSHTTVIFDNKMWVIGGYDANHQFKNDVWYTSDGTHWEQARTKIIFSPRLCHTSVVYDGKIWVIGGETSDNPWKYTNDVWYSPDGMTWHKAASTTSFSPRIGMRSAELNGMMCLFGGVGDELGHIRYNDVWCSDDGKSWKEVNESSEFPPRYYFTSQVIDDRLWVFGGNAYYNTLNDVFSSPDGRIWTESASTPRFTPRMGLDSTIFDNKVWIAGGFSASRIAHNDVWSFTPIDTISPGERAIMVNKTIAPWSIKEGTESEVTITFTNTGTTPVHDIEIMDTIIPEFTLTSGKTHIATPQTLMPNETRVLTYTVRANKPGEFTLPPASVLYAGEDGNYEKTMSNSPRVTVLAPLLSRNSVSAVEPSSVIDDIVKAIAALFPAAK